MLLQPVGVFLHSGYVPVGCVEFDEFEYAVFHVVQMGRVLPTVICGIVGFEKAFEPRNDIGPVIGFQASGVVRVGRFFFFRDGNGGEGKEDGDQEDSRFHGIRSTVSFWSLARA